MSRGFNKRAQQTQKLNLPKQGSTASKGVRYCKKCEKRKKKRSERKTPESALVPFISLILLWLMVCFAFYDPDTADIVLNNILFYSARFLASFVIYDCLLLARTCYVRFTRPVLDPQMGFAQVDPYLKEAIQVWCLFECLKDSKSKRGMIAAITQYLQAHVKVSLPMYLYNQIMRVDQITDWSNDSGQVRIEEMIETAFGTNSLVEHNNNLVVLRPQDGTTIEPEEVPWHAAMDSAFNNWKEFRSSTIAKRFVNLINVIVTAGMCSTADLSFKVGNVALFSPIVSKKQLAAGDVFEAFYEAISGFMKGGWRVFRTGEVSAFFMEDDKVSEFDQMYNEIRSWHGYALAGNLREYTEIDDNEYEARLKKAIEFGDNLLKFIKRSQTFERKYVSDRMDRLRDNETEFTQLRTRGGLRVAPFSICLFGQSGCGKSCLTNLTVNAGLIYNNLSAEKDRIATWADNDKFASSVRSHINAIIFDDFANTKEDFMDFSPAYRLIQVINNIKYLAPMADVFLKGKVSLNPYFCIVSTNVEFLNAAKYSNEPESVLRRLFHVKVEPKEEFCENGILSKSKIEASFGKTPCPDVWYISVRTYEARNSRSVNRDGFKTVKFNGKNLDRVSVLEYLEWVQLASFTHFAEEEDYISNQEGIPTACEKCSLVYCNCPKHTPVPTTEESPVLTPESGVMDYANSEYLRSKFNSLRDRYCSNLSDRIERYTSKTSDYFQSKADVVQNYYREGSTSMILTANSICDRWNNFDYLPEQYVCHPNVLKFGLIFWKEDLRQSLITGNVFFLIMFVFTTYGIPRCALLWFALTIAAMYWFTCATIQTYKLMIRDRILELKDVVKSYTECWQFKYALIGLGAIALILATFRARYTKLDVNTGLNPENMEELQERNDAANPWISSQVAPLPMAEPAKTTSSSDLATSMKTNLIGIVSDKSKTTLGFYITSNFLLIPTHFLREHGDGDVNVRCYKNGMKEVGSYFRDKLSKAFRVEIPSTDFTLCFVTSGGSMKDYRKFLPEGNILKSSPAKLVTRDIIDTALQSIPMFFRGTSQVAHTEQVFMGSYYTLPTSTRAGMCMSPVISDGRGSMILGFHLGGKGCLGGCGTLTIAQVNSALNQLCEVDGVVLSASCGSLTPNMGDFPSEMYGKSVFEGPHVHPKSAVNFLTEGACIDVYGSTGGKATPYSNVTGTLISDAVEDVFGVPQKWGPPKMRGKGNYPFQATLVHAALPSLPIGSVLTKSVRAMKDLTTGLKQKIPELFEAKPLSRVATVSGLVGVKFIDAMNFNTSPGFPLSGSKKPLLVDLDPKEYPECGNPRTFVPEVWDEFDRVLGILREGKRCYMIWKSCLKDEPTKLTKDKVRVFQGAPLALQLIVRMYFLPIIRIIQMNPILFECAVGVNAEGLEWEELWEAAMSKGKDRVLAGDYSKYDVRMPAQVTIAAFDVIIDIAEKCTGYTAEDIRLMRMTVHEAVYPVMAYNGDLIQLFGTNPSGQNLTVIMNSFVNSLLLRSCFFSLYPDGDFKGACAFLTYGDDVIGTVGKLYPKFTHITYAAWLAEHDMKFTMPDKESTPTHYMNEEDVDFLKRKCVFNPDLGQKVGLLSEDSIFKRLHSHTLSKELTLSMHSAENIQTSLHDWFYYGREIFEDRKEKLRLVAQKAGIAHLCPALDVSYDKRVNTWRHKYLGEELLEDDEEEILETQCGDLYVSTVDYNDHCIGTGFNPFFTWEHIITDLSLWFCHPIIWFLMAKGYRFKVGMIDYRWLVFLSLTTGGFRNFWNLIRLVLWTLFVVYVPFYCMEWYYINVILVLFY